MIELRLGRRDLARCRFAVSPLEELLGALYTVADRSRQPYHRPWLEEASRVASRLAIEELLALTTVPGYTPDFLSPPPRDHRYRSWRSSLGFATRPSIRSHSS